MTKKLIQIENNHDPRVLRIEWAMGNLCNQSCYYCFPGSHEGDIPWPSDIELLKKNFGKLFDHYKKFGKDIFQLYKSRKTSKCNANFKILISTIT